MEWRELLNCAGEACQRAEDKRARPGGAEAQNGGWEEVERSAKKRLVRRQGAVRVERGGTRQVSRIVERGFMQQPQASVVESEVGSGQL
jgi:hypothetical protein